MLNSNEIKQLIFEKELITGYIELDKQLQPTGFDLSLSEVYEYNDKGSIDFTNKERVNAETKKINPSNCWYNLNPGCYMVVYNETVRMPLNIAAMARSRSSMLRNAVVVETALWDPGYKGKSSSLLIVHNKFGVKIKENARIAQLVFFKTDEVLKGYSGIYQNERIEKKPT